MGNILSDGILSDEEDMQTALPDLNTRAILILDREHGLTDEACFAFCAANPDLNVARTRDGEIIIVPPAGRESDRRTLEAGGVLREWAIVLENLLNRVWTRTAALQNIARRRSGRDPCQSSR